MKGMGMLRMNKALAVKADQRTNNFASEVIIT